MSASILLLEPTVHRSRRIRRLLERQGHHVLTVPHAGIALGVLRHVQFDILIIPLAVVAISARDLSKQVKLLQPALRVLVMDEAELNDSVLYSIADAYVRKPISDSLLQDAVQALLDRASGAVQRSPSFEAIVTPLPSLSSMPLARKDDAARRNESNS